MDQSKPQSEIPHHVLTALEDLAYEVSDLQELMLALAASAGELEDRLPSASPFEPIH